MRLNTLFYNFSQGLKNIWRNKMFSLASIATMSACIFLFGIFYSLGVNFSAMVQSVEEGVAVTVFFQPNTPQETIDAVGNEISQREEVADYTFISAEEAWEEFKQIYFEGREELAEGFSENPIANCANYEIYLNDVSKQQELVDYLSGLEGVREVHQSEVAAKTLSDFNTLLGYIFAGVILILVAVAVFLINNTVRVGISVRREEIAIMKLIGAKDNFVRAPFVVEGVFIGLVGSAIPLVLLYFMYRSVIAYVAGKFSFLSGFLDFVPIFDVFRILVPVSLLLGVGIGYLGSRFTVRRHLKV